MPQLLEEFGEFLVPDLPELNRPMLEPHWRTLDVLEHTEGTIHRVVRMRNPEEPPPVLRCERLGPHEVRESYN